MVFSQFRPSGIPRELATPQSDANLRNTKQRISTATGPHPDSANRLFPKTLASNSFIFNELIDFLED